MVLLSLSHIYIGGTYGVMVIIIGIEHSNQSSNPVVGCLHFTLC